MKTGEKRRKGERKEKEKVIFRINLLLNTVASLHRFFFFFEISRYSYMFTPFLN